MKWENKAKILYEGTTWEKKAIAAGKSIDDKLDRIAKGPYGAEAPSSFFDMAQYLAYFDYEVLVRRGLQSKIPAAL